MTTNNDIFIKYDCHGNACINYCKNLVDLFYDYWLSKVEVINDNKKQLKNIFDNLNFLVMKHGIVPVLVDYGSNITISEAQDIYYDKNLQPIATKTQIYDTKGKSISTTCYAVDYKIKKNSILYQELLKNLGWTEKEIIYQVIFFQNNFRNCPSLENLNKIIANIHKLDELNDENHDVINAIYMGKSDKQYTEEQLTNFGVKFSSDGRGILITTLDGNQNLLNLEKNFIIQSLSKWPGIKDELLYWIDSFFELSGVAKEKLSNQRENQDETYSRVSRVSALEKQYFKYRQKFIDDFNNYFAIELALSFDSIIKNPNYQYQDELPNGQILTSNKIVKGGNSNGKTKEKG